MLLPVVGLIHDWTNTKIEAHNAWRTEWRCCTMAFFVITFHENLVFFSNAVLENVVRRHHASWLQRFWTKFDFQRAAGEIDAARERESDRNYAFRDRPFLGFR